MQASQVITVHAANVGHENAKLGNASYFCVIENGNFFNHRLIIYISLEKMIYIMIYIQNKLGSIGIWFSFRE